MHSVAVVGLGRIGSQYPEGTAGTPRSHVEAVLAAEGLAISALVDSDPAARRASQSRWPQVSAEAYRDSLAALEDGAAAIIVLATPPAGRLDLVRQALDKHPKVLLVEKPLAGSLADGLEMARLAEDAGVLMRVNFPRSLDPDYLWARRRAAGTPASVVARYGSGLFNYGSHLVDLLLDWFGPVASVRAFGDAGGRKDPILTVHCTMAAGFEALLIGTDGLGYDLFECDLLLADRRIRLTNGGVEKRVEEPVRDLYYPGYAHLRVVEERLGRLAGLGEFYAAARDHLETGAPLGGCDGRRAAQGLAVIEAALRSARAAGRPEVPAEAAS